MSERWLQQKFSEFIIEIEKQKNAIRGGRWAYQPENPVPFDPKNPGDRGPNPVWEALADVLRRQAREAGDSGASGLNLYREAQYAMVALADEIFMSGMLDWPGKADWNGYPLEMAFFNTRSAGQQLFDRIEKVLARRDPGERDLAEIYFNVISLGFRGKYFVGRQRQAPGAGSSPELQELRRRLHSCATDGRSVSSGSVSPQAYEHIEERDMGSKIPNALQSLVFLGIAILVLLGTSILFNEIMLSGIDDTLDDLDQKMSYRLDRRADPESSGN